ncbi:Hypothetical predicted protein [Mytilus galloprovincialis]|uniref:Uncharacterized protein n=1 Tax=Mytilus galloprovincialis TaxID=29158 RepID=A0A8B6GXM1_MYTGA|nr:Hypothetical predicted protein [Mytilus galloprovincialis]
MVRANRITHDEMLKMAGEKIADFCRGYKLYYGKKIAVDSMLRAGEQRAVKRGMRGCLSFCWNCSIVTEFIN